MKKLLFIVAVFIFLFLGCEDEVVNIEEEQSEISIITPTNNSTVSGIITIAVNYNGEEEIERVEYYVNSTLIGTVTSTPFSCSWNTTEWSNGSFELVAIGYTINEENIVSNTVSGTIYNEVPTEANIIFDTSDYYPYYRGYKYTVRSEQINCGDGLEYYPYLTFSTRVKNIGGSTAINVKVTMSVIVTSNIGTNLTFLGQYNYGSLSSGESKSASFDNSGRAWCQYGPYNQQNFSEVTIDDIITQINWD